MDAARVIRVGSFVCIACTVCLWGYERNEARKLQARLEGLENRPATPAVAIRDAIKPLRASPPSEPRPATATRPPPALVLGGWSPVTEWRNEGRSSPRATVSTMLWAAAGGDLAATQGVVEFDDEARSKARGWFAALPEASRQGYANAEELVFTATMRNIAPVAAQLVWENRPDENSAIIGMFVTTAANRSAATHAPGTEAAAAETKVTILTLRRGHDGWRVVIPAQAIDRIIETTSARTAP